MQQIRSLAQLFGSRNWYALPKASWQWSWGALHFWFPWVHSHQILLPPPSMPWSPLPHIFTYHSHPYFLHISSLLCRAINVTMVDFHIKVRVSHSPVTTSSLNLITDIRHDNRAGGFFCSITLFRFSLKSEIVTFELDSEEWKFSQSQPVL